MAAEAMAAAGYRHCLNVAEGFEGPMDADRHRGQIAGWKFEGLDWVQGHHSDFSEGHGKAVHVGQRDSWRAAEDGDAGDKRSE